MGRPSPRWAALWLLLAHHTLAVPRIVPLLHGWHFDNLIRDSVAPPPALVVFYGSSWCQEAFNGFGLDERRLPTRAHLFVGTYDIDRIDDVGWVGEPRLERPGPEVERREADACLGALAARLFVFDVRCEVGKTRTPPRATRCS